MIKKFIASTLIATTIVLTGCSSKAEIKAPEGYTTIIDDQFPDLTKADQLLSKGKSTTDDVRSIFGTPNYIAKTQKTNKIIYVYCFVPKDIMKGYTGTNFSRAIVTLGLSKNGWPNTNKVIYFVFNDKTLEDIKYQGYAHVQFHSFDPWYEAFQFLTEEEFKAPTVYSANEIYQMYANKLAQKKGVPVEQITQEEIHKKELGSPTFVYVSYYNGSLVLGEGIKVLEYPKPKKTDGIKSALFLNRK